ncbi:sugar transferase [Mycobacterium lacus]|uniref:Sugar transferase n=1 Tax=Mycobacterium lacus TaxID=169765 RepID=A0A7I7NHQ3_9MYCO|nr:sugar transferase [Mycobacterium lacus]
MTDKTAANPPKVSVVSTTYNQQAYVRQTFDGVVAQQTDFPVEIVVADDASTDATPAIIREYADRHPHLFRPIFRSENVGYKANLIGAFAATRGEYVAWCEGDDYWTDPTKLSKQVAFLDRHPETTVCFHPVRVVWEGGQADDYEFPPVYWRRDLSLEELLRRNFIQNTSVMYRRLRRYDDVPAASACVDYYLHVLHAVHGDIAMLPETMAVYRRHHEGMFSDAVVDPAKFWLSHGLGHAATFDVMLGLFSEDPAREEILGEQVDYILRQIAKVPGPEGRAVLLDAIAQHPRFAMAALRHHWAQTAWRRLKSRLATEMSDWRAQVYVHSARIRRQLGRVRGRVPG